MIVVFKKKNIIFFLFVCFFEKLAYVECQREDSTRTVAAAFTSGDSDTLGVGRRGVFYDVDGLLFFLFFYFIFFVFKHIILNIISCLGNDWDAKVVRVIAHPISVREACLRPVKKNIFFFSKKYIYLLILLMNNFSIKEWVKVLKICWPNERRYQMPTNC